MYYLSCGGQKSEMCLTVLGVSRAAFLLETLEEFVVPCLFQLQDAVCISSLMAASLHPLLLVIPFPTLTLTFLSPFCKDLMTTSGPPG